jgi:2-C-methyl-D-erythritol 2,4-cyclodiphosphate synthase
MNIRIGQGYDVHAFAPLDTTDNTSVVLGGVKIPFEKSLLAHSDGDVLIHALCDAMLGALALGDIGKHFPDTDSRYQNISSRTLLEHVVALLAEHNYSLSNADMTIVAERPKMANHILPMRENIAADAGISIDAISVKATTTELLGFTGREEGIACYATVLLCRSDEVNA